MTPIYTDRRNAPVPRTGYCAPAPPCPYEAVILIMCGFTESAPPDEAWLITPPRPDAGPYGVPSAVREEDADEFDIENAVARVAGGEVL